MTEERRAPDAERPGSEQPPSHPTPEPGTDPTLPAAAGSRERTPRPIVFNAETWSVFSEVPVQAPLGVLFEALLLLRLDPGGDVELTIHVEGRERVRQLVTAETARRIREVIEDGPRVPPAVHWRWMHGSPVLAGVLEQIGGLNPALEGAGAVG